MSETPTELMDVRAALEKAMEGTIGVKHPASEILDSAHDAALATAGLLEATAVDERPARLEELAEGLPGGLRAWLFELPSFLSKKKRPQTGHELCDAFGPLLGEAYMEAERNVVRYEAGEVDEALAGVDAARERFGDHPWVLARGARLRERHGELRRARKELEEAVEAARSNDINREDLRLVYDSLIQFLQDQGDQGTAIEVSKQMLEDFPEIEEEYRTEQIVNEEPKVGRNDSCPCGSGKKFKKCCGR